MGDPDFEEDETYGFTGDQIGIEIGHQNPAKLTFNSQTGFTLETDYHEFDIYGDNWTGEEYDQVVNKVGLV